MEAPLTSKCQITIPVHIRSRLHLKPSDILEFDETASFLKATKTISPQAWEEVGKGWKDPWSDMAMDEVMDDLRSPVSLPQKTNRENIGMLERLRCLTL